MDIENKIKDLDLKVNQTRDYLENLIDIDDKFYKAICFNEKIDLENLKVLPNNEYTYFLKLGVMYFSGTYVKKDLEKAEKYFLKIADKNILVEFALGNMYLTPNFKNYNLELACKYLLPSLKCEYFDGELMYYDLCKKVNNEKYNEKFACKLLKKKIPSDPKACFIYADCLKRNIIQDDKVDIENLLKIAMDNNIENSLYEYVSYVSEKYGVDDNIINLLKKSKDIKCMFFLASIYKNDKKYFNIDEAIKLYEICASENKIEAYYELARIYLDEKYKIKDKNKAISYLKKASENGLLIAELELIKQEK